MQLRLYDDRFRKAMRAWDNWAELVPRLLDRWWDNWDELVQRLMDRRQQRCARSACMYVHLRAAYFMTFRLRCC